MRNQILHKTAKTAAQANMPDYAAAGASFSWAAARALLDGLPGGAINIAFEAVDRPVQHGQGAKLAFPKPVIVRMSNFKTNEYANLLGGQQFEPNEENPMIGFRGASRYYSPS